MTTLAVDLFQATAHLGPNRAAAYGEFLTSVQAIEGPNDYCSYPALAQALTNAGYDNVSADTAGITTPHGLPG
jgi:hypothetical protein